jgi:hypothetical protein
VTTLDTLASAEYLFVSNDDVDEAAMKRAYYKVFLITSIFDLNGTDKATVLFEISSSFS